MNHATGHLALDAEALAAGARDADAAAAAIILEQFLRSLP